MLRTVKTVNEINHARLLCVVLTSAGVLTDRRDIAVERYETCILYNWVYTSGVEA